MLWRTWGRAMPSVVAMQPEHYKIFERMAAADRAPQAPADPIMSWAWVRQVGDYALAIKQHLADFAALLAAVLYPRGVRAVQEEIVELDRIAADLQERPVSLDRAEG